MYVLENINNDLHWSSPKTYGQGPSPRESHTCVAYKNNDGTSPRLFIYGGMSGVRLSDLWILYVNTMMWIKPNVSGVIPLPRSLHTATLVNNKMFIIGGWVPSSNENPKTNESTCSDMLGCYNLDTCRWENLSYSKINMPRPRAGHSACSIENKIYVWSGRGDNKKDSIQSFFKDIWFFETRTQPIEPTSSYNAEQNNKRKASEPLKEISNIGGKKIKISTDKPILSDSHGFIKTNKPSNAIKQQQQMSSKSSTSASMSASNAAASASEASASAEIFPIIDPNAAIVQEGTSNVRRKRVDKENKAPLVGTTDQPTTSKRTHSHLSSDTSTGLEKVKNSKKSKIDNKNTVLNAEIAPTLTVHNRMEKTSTELKCESDCGSQVGLNCL